MIKLSFTSFLNRIKKFIWHKLIPLKILVSVRHKLGPNRFGRVIRQIILPYEFRPGYDFFDFYMNDQIAEWIRYRSVEYPHTQRALATAFKEEYPDFDVVKGSQIDGRDLQRYCEDYLNIDLDEERDKSREYKEAIQATAKIFRKAMDEVLKDSNTQKTLDELED